MTNSIRPLCHRCEYRAAILDAISMGEDVKAVHVPRGRECRGLGTARFSCYAFKPTKPLQLVRSTSEGVLPIRRPMGGPGGISARMESPGVVGDDWEVVARCDDPDSCVFYWRPGMGFGEGGEE